MFLDDSGFVFNEHRIQFGTDWKNSVLETCPGVGCPLCEQGNQKRLAVVHTIVDFDGYQDRDGKIVDQYKKHLYVLGVSVADILKQSRANWGGLKGHLVKVMRTSAKEANTGSSFDHCLKDGRTVVYPLEQVAARGIDITPFNYVEIFKPRSIEALRTRYGKVGFEYGDTVSSAGGYNASSVAQNQMEDDVPFN